MIGDFDHEDNEHHDAPLEVSVGKLRWTKAQCAFLRVTNLSTLGTAALHQIILIGTPECISCNSFWIAVPFLTMHTSHWGQIGLALHWTLLHASESVQGAFLAIWWSLLGFPYTAVEYQITPSLHPEPRDGGCIFTKWTEPGNATASGLNEKPPKCTISQQLPLLGLHAMISDSNKIVFILTVHAFEPSAAWQRQASPLELPKLLGFTREQRIFPGCAHRNRGWGGKLCHGWQVCSLTVDCVVMWVLC